MSTLLQSNKIRLWIIVVVGFLIYLPTLFNGFVWDDEEQIVNNPQIRSLANLPAFFAGSTFNAGGGENLSGLYYRPLMTSSFTLVYSIFGLNPFFFHLVQIIVHVVNASLLYLILFYIFKRFEIDSRLAFFCSLLFLIHPINVEAVSYLSGYQEVLFFFFAALSFLLILRNYKFKKIYWATFLILFSLLAKETGAVFAGVIFIYLLFFEEEKIWPFLISIVSLVLTYGLLRLGMAHVLFNKHGLTPISNMDFGQRLAHVPQIILTYLKTFVWPANLVISQQWAIESINFDQFWMPLILVSVFIVTTGVYGFYIWKKKNKLFKLWLFFLIWFLAALGFHLQIFPLDLTVSDRWFYLTLAGLSGLIVVSISSIKINKLVVWFSILILFILSVRTVVREFDWRDGLSLYSHDIKNSRNSFDLENNLGVELFRVGDFKNAKIHFQRSVELSPQWWTNWNNLGTILEREGDLEKAQEYYRRSIDNGQYYLAFENYAGILIKQKKFAEAKVFLEKEALPRLPYNSRLQEMWKSLYNSK